MKKRAAEMGFVTVVGALVACTSAAAAQPSALRQRAEPPFGLEQYLGPTDYPPAARSRGERGTTEVRLTVGVNGRITGCAVTGSSGSALLDSTTCRLLRARALFRPARDANGNPVEDHHDAIISWPPPPQGMVVNSPAPPPVTMPAPQMRNVIDARGRPDRPVRRAFPRGSLQSLISRGDYPQAAELAREQGTTHVTLLVSPEGRVTHCRVRRSSGSSLLDNSSCRLLRARARFTPAVDARGSPTADVHESSISWRLPARR